MTEASEVDELRDWRARSVRDLAAWWRAQIDEDERLAQAARHGVSGRWRSMPCGAVEFGPEEVDWPEWSSNGVVVYDSDAPTPEQAEHIANHDPVRALREVEAKRRTIDLAQQLLRERDHPFWAYAGAQLLRLGALPYADRPGYREEWRPEERQS